MSDYRLHREQWVPKPIEGVFEFLSDVRNLEAITASFVGYRILTPEPIIMKSGTLLDYYLRLYGIPIRWRTEILEWNPPHFFSDKQVKGPYRLWLHKHTFQTVDGGTRITDDIQYALPFGILGRTVHALKVRGVLERVFNYREGRIAALFNAGSS